MGEDSGEYHVLAEGVLMTFIFLTLFISISAFAIPLSLQNMRPDKSYFSFASDKYLKWHFKNFYFPVLTPLEKELISGLDHWNVPDNEALPQLSLCHREEKGKGSLQSLRIWISEDFRSKEEFKGKVFPEKFIPWFYERNSEGLSCLLGRIDERTFESWCRPNLKEGWKFHHREIIKDEHLSWKNAFPLMTAEEIRLTDDKGHVSAIRYHRAMTHVSLVPRSLLMVVRAHSQDSAFGFERVIYEADGTMSVCYP